MDSAASVPAVADSSFWLANTCRDYQVHREQETVVVAAPEEEEVAE